MIIWQIRIYNMNIRNSRISLWQVFLGHDCESMKSLMRHLRDIIVNIESNIVAMVMRRLQKDVVCSCVRCDPFGTLMKGTGLKFFWFTQTFQW